MPRYIVKFTNKNRNYYLEWSTVVDAPVTYGLSRSEFEKYYQEEYGNSGMSDLSERMERVEKYGHSSRLSNDIRHITAFNRAGYKECTLSQEELIRKYCLREKLDENHPCWIKRREAMDKLYEEGGGANYEDLDKILEKYPYGEL